MFPRKTTFPTPRRTLRFSHDFSKICYCFSESTQKNLNVWREREKLERKTLELVSWNFNFRAEQHSYFVFKHICGRYNFVLQILISSHVLFPNSSSSCVRLRYKSVRPFLPLFPYFDTPQKPIKRSIPVQTWDNGKWRGGWASE